MTDWFETTDFQQRCREDGSHLLRGMGADGDGFRLVRGRRTSYYEGRFRVKGRPVHIFLYPDQAEFAVNGRWAHFQTPDFQDGAQFATGFLSELAKQLRDGVEGS